jgi:hypothetical protein
VVRYTPHHARIVNMCKRVQDAQHFATIVTTVLSTRTSTKVLLSILQATVRHILILTLWVWLVLKESSHEDGEGERDKTIVE